MSVVLIVVGFILLQIGARTHVASDGNQQLGSGLITLIMQVGGIGLMIYGLVKLFS